MDADMRLRIARYSYMLAGMACAFVGVGAARGDYQAAAMFLVASCALQSVGAHFERVPEATNGSG